MKSITQVLRLLLVTLLVTAPFNGSVHALPDELVEKYNRCVKDNCKWVDNGTGDGFSSRQCRKSELEFCCTRAGDSCEDQCPADIASTLYGICLFRCQTATEACLAGQIVHPTGDSDDREPEGQEYSETVLTE
ncbi:MAG: hypothetical protein AAGF57_09190 [Pseudomonadota bacterium]